MFSFERSLYIADYGSDRVRKIDLTQDPLNRGWNGGKRSELRRETGHVTWSVHSGV